MDVAHINVSFCLSPSLPLSHKKIKNQYQAQFKSNSFVKPSPSLLPAPPSPPRPLRFTSEHGSARPALAAWRGGGSTCLQDERIKGKKIAKHGISGHHARAGTKYLLCPLGNPDGQAWFSEFYLRRLSFSHRHNQHGFVSLNSCFHMWAWVCKVLEPRLPPFPSILGPPQSWPPSPGGW